MADTVNIKDIFTREDYEAFAEYWHSIGGTGLRLPKFDNGLLNNKYFQEWLQQIMSGMVIPNDVNVDPDVRAYWNYYNSSIDNTFPNAVQRFAEKRKIWNALSAVETPEQLPNWSDYMSKQAYLRELDIRQKGELLPGGVIRYNNEYYKDNGGMPVKINDPAVVNTLVNAATKTENQLDRDKFNADQMANAYNLWENQRQGEQEQQRWINQFEYYKQQDAFGRDYQNRQLALQERQQALDQQNYIANVKANPRNWIQAWFLENPNAGQRIMGPGEQVGQAAETAWHNLLQARQNLQEQMDWYNTKGRGYLSPTFQGEMPLANEAGTYSSATVNPLRDAAQEALAAESAYKQAMQARNDYVNTYGYPEPQYVPSEPQLPGNLKPFARDEGLKTAPRVASGQLWNKTDPVSKQMVGGWMNYAGGYGDEWGLNNYQSLVNSMLPKKNSWISRMKPARQV